MNVIYPVIFLIFILVYFYVSNYLNFRLIKILHDDKILQDDGEKQSKESIFFEKGE